LVVTDPGVMAAGWAGQVIESLEADGVQYTLFSRFTPNPKDSEVMAGAELYRQERCDVIVAVGGGSPIDCAKGIGVAMGLEMEGTPPAEVKTALVGAVKRLGTAAGIFHTLGQKGVRADDIPHLAATALRDACLATKNRQPRQLDIETIYAQAL